MADRGGTANSQCHPHDREGLKYRVPEYSTASTRQRVLQHGEQRANLCVEATVENPLFSLVWKLRASVNPRADSAVRARTIAASA